MSDHPRETPRHLRDLTPDRANARRHNPRNLGMLADALQEVGVARSIVIDEDGHILAGNGTVEAAAQVGIERVQVVDADGETLIAVRRVGLSDAQKRRLALLDNRTAELADWDPDVLAAIVADDARLLDGLFQKDELADILSELDSSSAGGDDPGADIDRADELRLKWTTERGQLWTIGRHRLLCGDSTDAADIARLMNGERASLLATDPPYNVGVDYGVDVDDAKAIAEYEAFTRAWFEAWSDTSDRQIVTPGWNNVGRWLHWFPAYYVAPWTKTNAMTRGKVAQWSCWEPILFYGDKWNRKRPNDVFAFPVSEQSMPSGEKLSGAHPCPKPLPMWVDVLTHYADEGSVVGEAFSESGTTHVAAEQTGRRCYGMEIEPKYVAVVLERLSGLGLTPRLVV